MSATKKDRESQINRKKRYKQIETETNGLTIRMSLWFRETDRQSKYDQRVRSRTVGGERENKQNLQLDHETDMQIDMQIVMDRERLSL